MRGVIVTCPDEAATIQVGEKIADMVKKGGVIELIGDVGSGKTTFVKGLATGLGYEGDVSSPSFALKNVYEAMIKINHFDLYRLDAPGLVKHELEEAIEEEQSLLVIEWAESAEEVLPEGRITINFRLGPKESRELKIILPEVKE